MMQLMWFPLPPPATSVTQPVKTAFKNAVDFWVHRGKPSKEEPVFRLQEAPTEVSEAEAASSRTFTVSSSSGPQSPHPATALDTGYSVFQPQLHTH